MINTPIQFASQLEKAGIPIPKAAADEIKTLHALREAHDTDHSAAAVADAMTGSLTAKTASDHLNRLAEHLNRSSTIDEAQRTLQQPIVARWYTALRANEDKLMAALTSASVEPMALVQQAGRHFGTDAKSEEILHAGIEAVRIWESLNEALTRLDAVRNIRVQFGELFNHGEQDVTWWIAAVADADDLEAAERAYYAAGNTFHNLAQAGYTLCLNTSAGAAEVGTGARAATDRRIALEAKRTADTYRSSLVGLDIPKA